MNDNRIVLNAGKYAEGFWPAAAILLFSEGINGLGQRNTGKLYASKNMGGRKFLRAKKGALFIKDKKKRDSYSNRRMPLICNGIKFEEDGKVPLF